MELDELKLAWRTLDARLQQQEALARHAIHDRQSQRARRRLRPLFWGQLVQMLFGLLVVLFSVAAWTAHRDSTTLVVAGVVMQAYGVAVTIVSGVVLGRLGRIDYTAPVLDIQRQLARLRRDYVIGGMVAGLPWWLLWMPALMLLAGLDGNVQGMAWLQSWLWNGIGLGVVGLLATGWFHRWSRAPGRAGLARTLEDGLTGRSLRGAQQALDELARFERG
jgi:hypothetical protein